MNKEDAVHTYNRMVLSHKKNEIVASAATWTEVEIIILSQVRKRKTNTICYYLYVDSKISHQ